MSEPIPKTVVKRLVRLALYRPLPKTWGDCVEAERYHNCEVARCRYNLKYTIRKSGRLKRHNTKESCALAVAARGEHTNDEIGEAMGCTGENARQVLDAALEKCKRSIALQELANEHC